MVNISIIDNNENIITNNNHIANINPFRYRSYYYDKEINLYYLNSRYYNPVWGRFINSDNYIISNGSLFGSNMYLYCNNNFINYIDSTGYFIDADLLVDVLVGGALLVNSASRTKQKSKEIKRVQTKNNEKKVCPSPQYSVNFDKALKKNAKKIV